MGGMGLGVFFGRGGRVGYGRKGDASRFLRLTR